MAKRYRVQNYLALLAQQKEIAFKQWKHSGYRDDAAYNDWMTFTHLALQATGTR